MKRINGFFRLFNHFWAKSNVIALGFEHFFAMVPATFLFPILVNNRVGVNVIDISLVLFTSGMGTIVFTIVSKGKIPAYLGSSFAYIGFTVYLIEIQVEDGIEPHMAYCYVGWAYVFSGLLLIAMSFLYKKANIEKCLSFILPASVVGPAISLIGLELADAAVVDSGFDIANGNVNANSAFIAISTLFVIVLFSLMKQRKLKNAAIIVGVFVGFLIFILTNGLPDIDINLSDVFRITMPNLEFPLLYLPKNCISLFISVVPVTLVIFTENIGRVTVIDHMVNQEKNDKVLFNNESVKQLQSGLFSHGLSFVFVSILGSVPNTIYAENIAVMGIHTNKPKSDPDPRIEAMNHPYSTYPLIVAACIAILFSFADILQTFLIGIPKPIVGGMELFLFGIISAPGIQLLVDQRVDYKKTSNQIITAAVLISGVSGLSVDLGIVELKGMSLGFMVGIILNLLVCFLKWTGNICDVVSFEECLEECLGAMIGHISNAQYDDRKVNLFAGDIDMYTMDASDLFLAFKGSASCVWTSGMTGSAEWAVDAVKHATSAVITDNEKTLFSIRKTANGLIVEFDVNVIDNRIAQIYLNDYKDAIDNDLGAYRIDITKNIPMRKVCELIEIVTRSDNIIQVASN